MLESFHGVPVPTVGSNGHFKCPLTHVYVSTYAGEQTTIHGPAYRLGKLSLLCGLS